jgi:SAM-dependent methyltransferase
VIDYDREADGYDETRGGTERARAAASAIEELLPAYARKVLDVACGTGIVTACLRRPGRTILGVDRSPGMLAKAAARGVPVLRGDATALPCGPARTDAVVLIWLLHLVPDPAAVIAEAARVLRRGGVLITTVDKNEAPFVTPSDLARLTAPLRDTPRDNARLITEVGARHGLRPAGETTFTGLGQGRSPRDWQRVIGLGRIGWATGDIGERIGALPGPDLRRPDPVYRLLALSRPGLADAAPGSQAQSPHRSPFAVGLPARSTSQILCA